LYHAPSFAVRVAFDAFVKTWSLKYDKAAGCVTKDSRWKHPAASSNRAASTIHAIESSRALHARQAGAFVPFCSVIAQSGTQ
jgi:hypothetical protein